MRPLLLLTTVALLACAASAQSPPGGASPGPASAGLGSAQCQPSPEHPFGWRGDGTGRYPAADPPLHWGRESVAVSQLRCQAARPKEGETGQPMEQGVISEWLVAGPISVPEDFKLAKDTIVPDTGTLRPAEGEELAGAGVKWKKFVIDSSVLDWSTLLGRNHKPGLPPAEVVAHAYVYSPAGGAFAIHSMHNATGQVFVNGKMVPGQVNLSKGWNSILLKVLSGKTVFANTEGLDSRFSFFGMPKDEYVTQNVAWVREMPPSPTWGGSSVSTPVLAGDRLFVTCEYRTLCCLDKNNGKVLWVRTSTFYDAMTDQEKKANPEIVQEIEPLAAKLHKIDESYATGATAEGNKLEIEKQINKLAAKVDDEKYSGLGVNKGTSEVGVSVQTPVTDGRRVYVSYVAALLACYDVEGNRQWVGARPLTLHGERVVYPPSPILTDGKFVAHNPWGTVALDAASGQEKWRIMRGDYKVADIADPVLKGYLKDGMDNVTSSLLRLNLGQEPLVVTTAYAARARDGKLLATIGEGFYDRFPAASGYSSPILSGTTMYKLCKQQDNGGLVDLQVWTLPASVAEPFKLKKDKSIRIDTQRFPCWCFGEHNAALLYHDGLVYCVCGDGVLSVVDVEKGEVVYQQLLDADLSMHHGYGAGRGGMCASPTLAGKYIYLFGNQGTCLVIEPGRSFKLVARNRLENVVNGHQDIMVSSPIFEGSRMYFRTDGYVYCIEGKP
jgi:outer membrane protein assembly factor BamB